MVGKLNQKPRGFVDGFSGRPETARQQKVSFGAGEADIGHSSLFPQVMLRHIRFELFDRIGQFFPISRLFPLELG
ncbi:MAG: Uncharacterised protein [Cellulomonadaceae bacterium TMED98]|nr:MAG: Uncharacterised protein [Cellulomonadaceae bacterium TMED98]